MKINRKAVSCVMLAMLLLAVSETISDFDFGEATPGTIYIKADGNVDPITAPIERDGSLYTFTDDISDTIIVQRSNIIIDGDWHTLQGSWGGIGFNLTNVENVAVRHTNVDAFEGGIVLLGSANCSISLNYITNCDGGIWVDSSINCTIFENNILYNNPYGVFFWDSTNCTIHGNNITNNWDGAVFYGQSDYNNISLNNIIANDEVGVWFDASSYCIIDSNTIAYNQNGVQISDSSNNEIHQNAIGNNRYGVVLEDSSDNKLYHNNFTDNSWGHAYVPTSGYANSWDDGYPSGGNFWDDYDGVDYYSGPNQDQPGADGIGDTAYVIETDNIDDYPLMNRKVYDWPMVGYDPARTSYSPSAAPNTNTTAWIVDLPAAGAGWWPYPVVSEGRVFIGLGGNLTAWNEADGDLLWNYATPAGLGNPCDVAVADGRVFCVAHEGNGVYASNATTGQHLWTLTGGTYDGGEPVIVGDRLYVGGSLGDTGVVYCLNATNGAVLWSYYPTQDRVNSIAVAYERVYVGCGHWETSTAGAVYCLDMYDGSYIWSFNTNKDYTGGVAVANGRVYFSASSEGVGCIIYALNATNGAVVWSTTRYPNGDSGRTAVAYGKVFICLGYSGRGVYALNETNGDEIWAFPIIPEQPVPGHQSNPLWAVVADGKVFFGPSYPDHMLYAVNQSNGQIIWSYKLTGAAEGDSAAVAGGQVFVADHWGQKLYAFGPTYVVRIKAYCYTEGRAVSVGITMDGSSTGYNTAHTFTKLTGTHTFTVPNTDTSGHVFKHWNTGEPSTTITVSTSGTYTAYYQAKYSLTITSTSGGTTDPAPGIYAFWDGTIVAITAMPGANYYLEHWELDGVNIGWRSTIAVKMNSNHLLRAVFVYIYWDFPRLDEIYFKIEYPYTVSLEAAKACEIDTYVDAIKVVEVDTLKNPPYGWTVTAAPGFHMCYIGINCRGITPETSSWTRNYHSREPGFALYPLELAPFRYALELIVGCEKDVWITDIYGYINVRLDTCVPPANVYWYNPEITPYPEDWDQACEMLYAAGFTGTPQGNDWIMPNDVPLADRLADPDTGETGIYVMSPNTAPTSMEIARRHCKKWNLFFCGDSGDCDYPLGALFMHEPIDPNIETDVAFYDRDFDMYLSEWNLDKFPDYLYHFFHTDTDLPGAYNSPGLSYRPLDVLLKSFYECMWTDYLECRWIGPGPVTVTGSTTKATKYKFVDGTEELWVGDYSQAPDFPFYVYKLEKDVDYEVVKDSWGRGIAIHFLNDIGIPEDYYIHIVYKLVTPVPISSIETLRQMCWDAQLMLYYACPYLPIYSRNYHDLYKPGLTCWVPSLGYGSAAYQLKWTYASIHWASQPIHGSINWHLPGPIYTLNPLLARSVYEMTILNRLYDQMLETDAYTHADIPWCALDWKIEDWTGPSGEPGMIITFWIRNDLTWQDGDPITVDDFIWQYEFINSIKPSQLYNVWSTYHGCIRYSDYCFGIRVSATGIWKVLDYTLGPVYPEKIWKYFWGDKAAAEAFEPWAVAYTSFVAPEDWGPTPLPTCLYGSAEWIFDYFDPIFGTARVYKDYDGWARHAAQPCCQLAGIYSPTIFAKDNIPINIKTVIGLYTLNLNTKENCEHAWTLLVDGVPVANGVQTLTPLQFHKWEQDISILNGLPLEAGLHTFTLKLTNAYGTNVYTITLYVLIGDANGDRVVDIADISYQVDLFLREPGNLGYDPNADINNDGIIDMADISICIDHFLEEI